MKPESRRRELLTQQVGDELVIYDQQSHEAHRLSPTAAIVWREANGDRSIAELSLKLRDAVTRISLPQTPLNDDNGEALVRLAISELDRVGLLARGLPGLNQRVSRREMIGITAALVPVVASILVPTPAMAATAICFGVRVTESSFNGRYVGPGVAGEPNACGLGPSQVTIELNYPSMTITHGGGTVFTSIALSGSLSGCSLTVIGPGTAGPGSYQTTNSFTFTRDVNGVFTVAGAQQISYSECGTTPYNINGTRQ
jgi:hypothetical protein